MTALFVPGWLDVGWPLIQMSVILVSCCAVHVLVSMYQTETYGVCCVIHDSMIIALILSMLFTPCGNNSAVHHYYNHPFFTWQYACYST